MGSCIFCGIARHNTPHHEIVWESPAHVAFLDINPSKTGHTLVIPRAHSANVSELTEEDHAELFRACREVSVLLKQSLEADLIATVIEGTSVPHTHVHLIPLKRGEKLAHFENHRASAQELECVATRIRRVA